MKYLFHLNDCCVFSSVCDGALFNWFALIVWCVEMIKSSNRSLLFYFLIFFYTFYWGDVGGGVGDQCKRPIRHSAHTLTCVDYRMCGFDQSKHPDPTILFSLFVCFFLWRRCWLRVINANDPSVLLVLTQPEWFIARNRVNQTLLIISDYHYSFSLFLIIVIIINIISDSFKTGSIRSYWLFLPSHMLHFRKKNH